MGIDPYLSAEIKAQSFREKGKVRVGKGTVTDTPRDGARKCGWARWEKGAGALRAILRSFPPLKEENCGDGKKGRGGGTGPHGMWETGRVPV